MMLPQPENHITHDMPARSTDHWVSSVRAPAEAHSNRRTPPDADAAPRHTTTEIRDTIELIAVLEGTAARFAAERGAASDDLVALRATNGIIRDLVSVTDHDTLERYLHLDGAFHRQVLKMAQSQILERALEQLMSVPDARPNGSLIAEVEVPIPHDIVIVAYWEHAGLVDAIKRREGSRAESLASQHARQTLGSPADPRTHPLSRVAGRPPVNALAPGSMERAASDATKLVRAVRSSGCASIATRRPAARRPESRVPWYELHHLRPCRPRTPNSTRSKPNRQGR